MNTIRLNGLVETVNRVREQLAAGILLTDAEKFRENVRRIVVQVEKICAQNDITPTQLFAPSRNAYFYLKNLDLSNLPIHTSPNAGHATTLRVENLIRIETQVQAELATLAATDEKKASVRRTKLQERIELAVQRVQEIAVEANSTPAQLPLQSRQVFEWLAFLASSENLDAHIVSLRALVQESDKFLVTQSESNFPQLNFEFANHNRLYRIKSTAQQILVTANEGFVGAPPEILQAFVRLAFRRESAAAAQLREYAHGDEFGEILLMLGLPTMELDTNTRGHHHDLADIFARVNRAYFDGKVTAPRLVWNRTLTFRKMGHYVPLTDTVMLSLTLDDGRVPNRVVDLVMYHELLHKIMGSQIINGRRYVHTPSFRQAERRFIDYTETEAWLKKWARQLGGIEEETERKSE